MLDRDTEGQKLTDAKRQCLRRQLVLNQLFCSIFKADKVDLDSAADLDDFDDLMQGESYQ